MGWRGWRAWWGDSDGGVGGGLGGVMGWRGWRAWWGDGLVP